MECPRCNTSLPEVAHFCHVCGTDLVSEDGGRKASFALKPDEPVASFALVSTIMPRGVSGRPNTYRLALEVTLALVALTAIVGAVPIALMIAAFAVPVVYIVYLYDVNLWEDEPITVTGAAFLLTLVLSIGWTLAWVAMSGHSPVIQVTAGVGGPTILGFLIAGVLAPVVGELIREAGPIFLASRPKFDDLMDGLTFGVISGVAYATGDTLVKHWALITGGFSSGNDGGAWLALLVLEGFIKPLVLGTATGIACAEFSGLGEGYDGFTNRYFRGFGEAVLASVLYFGGTYLLSFVPNPVVGTVLSILYGLVLLAYSSSVSARSFTRACSRRPWSPRHATRASGPTACWRSAAGARCRCCPAPPSAATAARRSSRHRASTAPTRCSCRWQRQELTSRWLRRPRPTSRWLRRPRPDRP